MNGERMNSSRTSERSERDRRRCYPTESGSSASKELGDTSAGDGSCVFHKMCELECGTQDDRSCDVVERRLDDLGGADCSAGLDTLGLDPDDSQDVGLDDSPDVGLGEDLDGSPDVDLVLDQDDSQDVGSDVGLDGSPDAGSDVGRSSVLELDADLDGNPDEDSE